MFLSFPYLLNLCLYDAGIVPISIQNNFEKVRICVGWCILPCFNFIVFHVLYTISQWTEIRRKMCFLLIIMNFTLISDSCI